MRIDSYTKFVLTVIALCLVWLSLGGAALLPSASAQAQKPTKTVISYDRVVIAGWLDEQDVQHQFPVQRSMDGKPIEIPGMPVAEVWRPK